MGVVYFSITPTFEPSRYYKCWIVCFYYIKIGSELQSYKTGTMSSLNKRIELFKEGVENVIDER